MPCADGFEPLQGEKYTIANIFNIKSPVGVPFRQRWASPIGRNHSRLTNRPLILLDLMPTIEHGAAKHYWPIRVQSYR